MAEIGKEFTDTFPFEAWLPRELATNMLGVAELCLNTDDTSTTLYAEQRLREITMVVIDCAAQSPPIVEDELGCDLRDLAANAFWTLESEVAGGVQQGTIDAVAATGFDIKSVIGYNESVVWIAGVRQVFPEIRERCEQAGLKLPTFSGITLPYQAGVPYPERMKSRARTPEEEAHDAELEAWWLNSDK